MCSRGHRIDLRDAVVVKGMPLCPICVVQHPPKPEWPIAKALKELGY